ncbi:MAG TPA: M28 family peptidase [Gemmatimonadaceae bacterium]|nr:M28 family peptidase [Gemmatimonadaceae bacterium]
MTRSSWSQPDPPDPQALLRAIAGSPRPTGSAAIENARRECAGALRALGYEVREKPFEYSAFPGNLGTPLISGLSAMVVALAARLGSEGSRLAPILIIAIGAAVLGLLGVWLSRHGVLSARMMRRRGVNLEATRGGSSPAIWLCAHLDSKSQPVPTLVRSAGLAVGLAGAVATAALALAVALGATLNPIAWALAAMVTLVGAIPVVLSTVGTRSPGALDNASGVATVIAAAGDLAAMNGVGVLITDAEELGLAGARAWSTVEGRGTVLNCDGVDDVGRVTVMHVGARPRALAEAVARAAESTGVPYTQRRMILGVLTDSAAFADAGMPSVTFSRGTWRTLARVHSKRDDLAHLAGTGIAETAALMAAAARQLGGKRS